MSKSAQDAARKLKRTPDSTRMIICEQVFDVRIGLQAIAVFHPVSKTSFAFSIDELAAIEGDDRALALKKAIWNAALDHIPSKSEKTTSQGKAVIAAQPGLFG